MATDRERLERLISAVHTWKTEQLGWASKALIDTCAEIEREIE